LLWEQRKKEREGESGKQISASLLLWTFQPNFRSQRAFVKFKKDDHTFTLSLYLSYFPPDFDNFVKSFASGIERRHKREITMFSQAITDG
jgi:hypothetical protein